MRRARVWLIGLSLACGIPLVARARSSADGPFAAVHGGTAAAQSVEVGAGQDLQSQLDSNPPGATVALRAGTYRLTAPLTFKNGQRLIGGDRVVLSGARLLGNFRREGRVWVVDGQSQEGAVVESAAVVCTSDAPRCNRPEDLFLDDRPLRHVATLTDVRAGTWYFDYAADRIVLGDDPTGHSVETSVTPFAVGGEAEGITIRGIVVEKFATPTHEAAINGRLTGMVIEHVEARLNHFAGIRTMDRTHAQNNHVHDNGALGFIGAGENIRIEHNEIDHNNTVGYNPYWAAGGTKWVYTTHLVVRDNDVHDNHGPGLWTDINNTDVLFEGNRVHDNDLSGIFHEVGYRAVIRNNVANRNGRARPFPGWVVGAGILVSSSSDVEVYGNNLTDNWQGIAGLEDERGNGANGPWVLARLHVHDNVIRQTMAPEPGSGRSGVAQVNDGTSAFTSGGNRFTNNTYALAGKSLSFFWMGRDIAETEWQRYGHDTTGRVVRSEVGTVGRD
ncbi:MAG: right-handed parallel beta-helix repeat-containing protein [Vicinamibacterales bacterium]